MSILLQALTKWGGALLELAHFRQGEEAYDMIDDAIKKFEAALAIDDKRHDALWCLGNAFTSQGFLSANAETAGKFFTKAGDAFKRAVEHEPNNDSYRRALEMSSKAPQLYEELQKQLQAAAVGSGAIGGGSSSSRGSASGEKTQGQGQKEKGLSSIGDFWYDAAGWVVLIGLGIGIAALSRSAAGTVPPK